MAIRNFQGLTNWLLIGVIVGSGIGFWQSAHADSGSSQAVMALIVLPNDTNMAPNASVGLNNSTSLGYNTDTTVSVLQKSEGIIYQVWVAI